jgi:hypothetical protein
MRSVEPGISRFRVPALPATTEERIIDTRAASIADSVMYREALANAAEACGWLAHWYDRADVFHHAAAALGGEDVDAACRRWAAPSGRPGKPSTSSRPPRRSRRERENDHGSDGLSLLATHHLRKR